ncbi:MAG: 3-dehydroquinate synthase [Thiohalomonadales bacterium]
MRELNVSLGSRSYPIYIGSGLLGNKQLLEQHIPARQVLVVTNVTVAPLYLEACLHSLEKFQCETIILPDGEQYKNLDTLNLIFDKLLSVRFDRSCTLVALGGGVIGDITGFAAASYQRGVNFIQIPTTLLAQVDSSVGGKTGVNHKLGKNMIGAFYQPRCVIADITTLKTLEDRQVSAGLAEVIKYGLIRDSEFLDWLELNMAALLALNVDLLAEAVEISCRHKSEIVAADEFEAGQRGLLNLGHTFAHAIENGMGYGQWLHGEAVAVGMVMAADLSARHQWISAKDVTRIIRLLSSAKLPTLAPKEIDPEKFMSLMAVDKKVKLGVINLILFDAIGKTRQRNDYDQTLLMQTLNLHQSTGPHLTE